MSQLTPKQLQTSRDLDVGEIDQQALFESRILKKLDTTREQLERLSITEKAALIAMLSSHIVKSTGN